MLPRAASRPVPGACHPRSSLRCPRSSRRHACWPASADKQPAWQMCMPPVRGSGSDLAHAPGSAGHVCTCHVQLWWQRPAAALTERRMRHQLAVASQPAALAPDDGTRLTSSLRPRARARICGACPHMSCAALVAAASGCLNGTQNAPTCRLVPKSSRRGKCASHWCVAVMATSRTRQDLRGMSTHVMCSSGGSGQRLP